MNNAIALCGFCRSGSTLLYNMLRATVVNYEFFNRERPLRQCEETTAVVSKRPLDIFSPSTRQRIIMIRDPRAIMTSVHWRDRKRYFVDAQKTIDDTPGIIEQWRAIEKLLRRSRHILVRYEDLVATPSAIQQQLGQSLGFEYRGKFEDFHKSNHPERLTKTLNGIRPVDAGHDWRPHRLRIESQFNSYPELFQILVEMGYESDFVWWDNYAAA